MDRGYAKRPLPSSVASHTIRSTLASVKTGLTAALVMGELVAKLQVITITCSCGVEVSGCITAPEKAAAVRDCFDGLHHHHDAEVTQRVVEAPVVTVRDPKGHLETKQLGQLLTPNLVRSAVEARRGEVLNAFAPHARPPSNEAGEAEEPATFTGQRPRYTMNGGSSEGGHFKANTPKKNRWDSWDRRF